MALSQSPAKKTRADGMFKIAANPRRSVQHRPKVTKKLRYGAHKIEYSLNIHEKGA
ncbi:hypothetical protein ROLI_024480 [Roseobacter fucihabitans]|uniref:Uncharacterized protein n=1 Tax=Roseobacter fucihabitans TaxID=1537242 RepID=A0ABZ2BTN9_9RHOB|nr:hypothetical protein [Roseobacter litoralis]MBC6965247.1 hypothetical protein [Roseobacter litoralis]